MSTTRIGGLVVAAIMIMVGGVTSSIYLRRIVDEVNRHRSAAHQESQHWWYLGKTTRVLTEYSQVCPDTQLPHRFIFARCVSLVGFVIGVFSL